MKLLFLDTETTGPDRDTCGLIQVSGIVDIDGKVVEEFDFSCRPLKGDMVYPEAMNLLGLNRELLDARPDPREAFDGVMKVFNRHINRYAKADKFYMVGQVVGFDHTVLDRWFKRHGEQYLFAYVHYHLIDLVALTAAFQVSGAFKLPSMKLQVVGQHFGIEFKAHDSKHDIRATREIFYRYVDFIKKGVL